MIIRRKQTQSNSTGSRRQQLTRAVVETTLIVLAALSLFGHEDLILVKRSLQGVLLETEIWVEKDINAVNETSQISSHNPQRFTHNLQLNLDRGLNIINCWSGQTMASWIYQGEEEVEKKFITWKHEAKEKILRSSKLDAPRIRANDTIYVAIAKLSEFTRNFLPFVKRDFVLITETWHLPYPDWIHELSDDIVNHPNLLQWFSNNVGNYTGGKEYHPKVSPFPLGLKPNMPGARVGSYRAPVPTYRKIFLEALNSTSTNKTNIFVGHLRETSEGRRGIPSGPNLDYPDYLRALANANYVLSPDGDHPDCHRHYESLGLGAIPITEMDPYLYRHLANSTPTIFGNKDWNLTSLEANLPDPTNKIKVNRNVVFEEYWMEHVEQVVGRPLRWWDVVRRGKRLLDAFATNAQLSSSERVSMGKELMTE